MTKLMPPSRSCSAVPTTQPVPSGRATQRGLRGSQPQGHSLTSAVTEEAGAGRGMSGRGDISGLSS